MAGIHWAEDLDSSRCKGWGKALGNSPTNSLQQWILTEKRVRPALFSPSLLWFLQSLYRSRSRAHNPFHNPLQAKLKRLYSVPSPWTGPVDFPSSLGQVFRSGPGITYCSHFYCYLQFSFTLLIRPTLPTLIRIQYLYCLSHQMPNLVIVGHQLMTPYLASTWVPGEVNPL